MTPDPFQRVPRRDVPFRQTLTVNLNNTNLPHLTTLINSATRVGR